MTLPPRPMVYIVDDDAAGRDGLALLLEVRGYPVRAFAGGEAFLDAVDARSRGCVLLDLRMPGLDGLEVQKALNERGLALPIIIMTAHGDVQAARAALMAGAFDFLEKPVEDALLRKTIDAALAHEMEEVARRAHREEIRTRMARLTPRERQVLKRVVGGGHNREIAAELGISARTVEAYKARLMDKLQVERIPDLIRLSIDFDPTSEDQGSDA